MKRYRELTETEKEQKKKMSDKLKGRKPIEDSDVDLMAANDPYYENIEEALKMKEGK